MLSKSKKSKGDIAFSIFNTIIMILIIVSCIYPFYRIFIISINDALDALQGGIFFLPRVLSFDSYIAVFKTDFIFNAFIVSVVRTVVGTITSLFATSLLAYGLSKKQLKFHNGYMLFCMITMFFSGGTISYFIVLDRLGFVDNFLVFILPSLVSVWNMIILKSFFENIPASLEESAKIDGGGNYAIFFKIVIPLAIPSLATVGLFNAVAQWNSWFDANIFIFERTEFYPLQTILMQIMNQGKASDIIPPDGHTSLTSQSVQYATMIIATVPIVLVYPFIQKYFVKGIMLGSVKE